MIWLRKIRNNEPFKLIEIDAIGEHVSGQELGLDLPVIGQRFPDWEKSQCGRLQLPVMNDEIPMPMAPVMAGVLIAGEIIKEHFFSEGILDSCYWNTLLGRFMLRNQPSRRLPRPNCPVCSDATFAAQHRRRSASGGGPVDPKRDNISRFRPAPRSVAEPPPESD